MASNVQSVERELSDLRHEVEEVATFKLGPIEAALDGASNILALYFYGEVSDKAFDPEGISRVCQGLAVTLGDAAEQTREAVKSLRRAIEESRAGEARPGRTNGSRLDSSKPRKPAGVKQGKEPRAL